MKWFITGGCGFIGTALVRRLANSEGHAIRVLDNLEVGRREDLAAVCAYSECQADRLDRELFPTSGVQLITGDILDAGLMPSVCAGADIIVHLAANTGVGPSVDDPRKDCRTNVIGTLNCLEAARSSGVRRFVFASSGAPLGECVPPIHENIVPHPVSPYGASKLAGEGYCSAYFRTFGVETVCLRFGNVYGPGSNHKGSVVAQFIRQALRGEPLVIHGSGEQTRDFLFIEDLVDAVLRASITPGIGGEVFQVATSRETSVGELADQLRAALLSHGCGDVVVKHDAPRLGDVSRNYSDTTKAMRLLGWKAKTTLSEGLEGTIIWFLQREQSGLVHAR